MSRTHRTLACAVAAVLFSGLTVGVAPSNAADSTPLRVLLTGDSIVHGFNGDYTWRYRLYKEFVRQGVPVNFVGSRNLPVVKAGYQTARYLDANFDRDHFAQGGSTLAWNAARIEDEVRAQQPDVVVLGAGINDLRNQSTPERLDEWLDAWINAARRGKPDVRMVISPVLDAVDPARQWLADRAHDYNARAAGTVAEKSTDYSPITMADTTRGWSVPSHTAENLHPNPTGETLIAQRIGETLHNVGLLPQAPNLYRWTSWNRQPRVGVVVRGNRAQLTWDAQALSGARVWMRREGGAASFPATLYGGGHMTTGLLSGRATYEFRIQMVRGRMSTPVGPPTRVVVPKAPRPAAVAKVVVDAAGAHWGRSTLATRYLVKFRKAGAKRWYTRRTTGLAVAYPRMVRAKVWAINSSGRSKARLGVR